ncbi:alanine racemase [Halanaerobium salsuginis]|uniref:Alanine racemase n=1 Tax=Halanaerobium salsuginis TaxID=29563 RepID=A0A1I4MRN0_9FIRM|nr:alanine racemase [Halanaerobium salsuginis]SFM05730.1 alanine racemase [Halanaerobium salsuginis]
MNNLKSRPAWLEIDLAALTDNYKTIKSLIPENTKIAAVVKADAYGHGAVKVAKKLSYLGVDYFCVASPDEGLELRQQGIKKPILVLGEILPEQYSDIIKANLIQAAASIETLIGLNKIASKAKTKIKIQLKIDTGMGRIGFLPAELTPSFFDKLKNFKSLEINGIFSHLARADESNKQFTLQQKQIFEAVITNFKQHKFNIDCCHIANSAAILDLPDFSFDLVRPGIILYGLLPSVEITNQIPLKAVLNFKTKIVQLRTLPANSSISYGGTYQTKIAEQVAVLPIGYKDGYPRLLSNRGYVLINGQRAPIRGRICMGQTIVSVDKIAEVKVGDEVVLLGKQKDNKITAAELAELTDTINYEIVCNLSSRLNKIYL